LGIFWNLNLSGQFFMKGEQIYVMRELLNFQGVYEHHGIDCGDGTIIHYRKGTDRIEKTPRAIFTDGRTVYTKHYDTSFIPDVVVNRAESRLGEQRYNLLFNNCEHFATWCKTGINHSQQVEDFIPFLSHFSPDSLSEPIAQALETNPEAAPQLVNQALADVKRVWDQLQPEYNQLQRDQQIWHRVALKALKQGRDDLAKAAIERKLQSRKRSTALQTQLEQLAKMTKTLIQQQQSFQSKV
jgi:Lecithin retinol acyltransferase